MNFKNSLVWNLRLALISSQFDGLKERNSVYCKIYQTNDVYESQSKTGNAWFSILFSLRRHTGTTYNYIRNPGNDKFCVYTAAKKRALFTFNKKIDLFFFLTVKHTFRYLSCLPYVFFCNVHTHTHTYVYNDLIKRKDLWN